MSKGLSANKKLKELPEEGERIGTLTITIEDVPPEEPPAEGP